MNNTTFDKLVEDRCNKIKSVLVEKAKEYASDKDRLHNFNVAARVLNCTPERALFGMMMKHFVSVMDIIDNVDKQIFASEYIVNEKIGDLINYSVLLEALLTERIQKK